MPEYRSLLRRIATKVPRFACTKKAFRTVSFVLPPGVSLNVLARSPAASILAPIVFKIPIRSFDAVNEALRSDCVVRRNLVTPGLIRATCTPARPRLSSGQPGDSEGSRPRSEMMSPLW